jgi:glycosyltransferase involved in cell wall biosynthesis
LKTVSTIAIVANATWNIYNFRLNLLRILTENDYHVIVITPVEDYEQYKSYQKEFPSVQHISLKHLVRKSTNVFQDLRLCHELFQIFKQTQPDLILNYTIKPNIYGGIIANLLKIKYLCVVTGLGYTFLHNGLLYRLSQKMYSWSFQNANRVIFENRDDKKLFNDLKLVSMYKSLYVKGCGIDIQHFYPMPKMQTHTGFVFCFMGRFLWDKGIGEWIEAAKIVRRKVPTTLFWLVGAPDEQNRSCIPKAQIKIWEDEQIIINQGFAQDVRPFIREADCIVLPSHREGMPTILAEAAAMCKPIIATDVAGCREIVEHGKNGYLVPKQSVAGLAVAMLKMLQLPESQLVTMGIAGRRKVVQEAEQGLIAQQFLKIVQECLHSTSTHTTPQYPKFYLKKNNNIVEV